MRVQALLLLALVAATQGVRVSVDVHEAPSQHSGVTSKCFCKAEGSGIKVLVYSRGGLDELFSGGKMPCMTACAEKGYSTYCPEISGARGGSWCKPVPPKVDMCVTTTCSKPMLSMRGCTEEQQTTTSETVNAFHDGDLGNAFVYEAATATCYAGCSTEQSATEGACEMDTGLQSSALQESETEMETQPQSSELQEEESGQVDSRSLLTTRERDADGDESGGKKKGFKVKAPKIKKIGKVGKGFGKFGGKMGGFKGGFKMGGFKMGGFKMGFKF